MSGNLSLLLLLTACTAFPALGAPIVYTLSTTATGTLGPSAFTNAVVTITLTGDTANAGSAPALLNSDFENTGTATVSVAGLSTATFTGSIIILSTGSNLSLFGAPVVAIAQLDNAAGTSFTGILLQTGPAFATYDLRTSLGPISGTGGVASGSHQTPVFPTTAGNFTWAIGQPLGTSTFAATTASAPAIKSAGVVPINSTATSIQSGEWASIYGSNLASQTATWKGDFPTSLGGTSVTINGTAAYLWYVSPTQINFQVPDDPSTGSVPVTVKTASGTSTSTVTLSQFGPSFSLLDAKHVTGIILRSNGSGSYGGGTYDIIGPPGSSLGYPTVAAKAGDSVALFGVGFGPTSPVVHSGAVFSGQAPAINPVKLLINNISVTPSFAGLSSAGLFQINVTVPSGLGSGDVPLVATVGGVQTPAGVVIAVQ